MLSILKLISTSDILRPGYARDSGSTVSENLALKPWKLGIAMTWISTRFQSAACAEMLAATYQLALADARAGISSVAEAQQLLIELFHLGKGRSTVHALNKNRVRALTVGRGLFLLVGIIGLILLILSFWLDTAKIGGILCASALIGHMATWGILTKTKPEHSSSLH